jgi:hypothetical protein
MGLLLFSPSSLFGALNTSVIDNVDLAKGDVRFGSIPAVNTPPGLRQLYPHVWTAPCWQGFVGKGFLNGDAELVGAAMCPAC